jgi:benzoate-CoA ligase family protein
MPNAAQEILRAGDDASVALRVHADDRRLAMTRGQLRRLVRQTAAALARRGVAEEQRVIVALPDCPEYVAAVLGAMWNGSVPVLVSSFLPSDGYAAFLDESRARAIVTTEPIADALRERGAGSRAVAILTVRGDASGTFREAIDGERADAEPFPAHADDPALWLYSSGTTGRPKGVVHLHRGVLHAIESYGARLLETGAHDVSYATSKLFFAYGLGAGLYFPLAAGGATVLSPEPFAPERTWRILVEERPSLFFAVPAVYRALLEHAPAEASTALAGVRRFVSAGEALPDGLSRSWRERFGVELLNGLGATETLHIFLSGRPGSCRPGTVGHPVPGYEVEIVDERGVAVACGTPGTLRVRGDSIAAGYWQRGEATARVFGGGWLTTGDQAVQDADGAFRILGRTDDMLKVSGQWVSPLDVEAVVMSVSGVLECGIVGAPGDGGLTELVACVVAPGDGADAVRARIDAACSERLPRFKRPKRIVFFELLPQTATGKLQRFALRDLVTRAVPAES